MLGIKLALAATDKGIVGAVAAAKGIMPKCPATGCGWDQFIELINNVIGLIFVFVPIIAGFWIIYAGVQIMLKGDSPADRGKWLNVIKQVIFGLLIVYGSRMIFNFITGIFKTS